VEEALRAEVAAVTEGEEAFVVLEGERRECRTEAELAERAGPDRQLGAAAAGEARVVEHAKADQPAAFAEGVDRADPAVEGEIEAATLQEDAAPELPGGGVAGRGHGDEALGDAAARGLGRDEERAEVAAQADAADGSEDLEPERRDAYVGDEMAALVSGVQLGAEGPLRSCSAGGAAIQIDGAWAATVRSGVGSADPVPPWLSSHDRYDLQIIRQGRAYALIPRAGASPHDTLELYSAAGERCGTLKFPADGLSMGPEGTVIGSSGDGGCTHPFWSGLLR